MKSKYDPNGCFNLVTEIVGSTFNRTRKNRQKSNIAFTDTRLFEIWCDCSHHFTKEKLKKLIIMYNTKSYEELEKFKTNSKSSFVGDWRKSTKSWSKRHTYKNG